MIEQQAQGRFIIVGSFIAAFLLTAMPLPDMVNYYRPPWVALVLMYWCMALPNRIGISTGWICGLLIDVLQGTLLGLNAVGFAILAYFSIVQYQRFRVFPLVQQSLIIGALIFILSLVSLWIRYQVDGMELNWNYTLPALSSLLIWPWVFIVLRDLRRHYHVS